MCHTSAPRRRRGAVVALPSTVGKQLRITFHGVRGSTPCHGEEVRRYGGNTSCVSLDADDEHPLLFDLGTGLRYFGRHLPHDGSFRGTCLLTHLHWDHTQGLPFFVPILSHGARLDVYAPIQEDGSSVREAMSRFIAPPLFPVELDRLPGSMNFYDVGDHDFFVGGYAVRSRLIPHVGNTHGYRVEWEGLSVAYLSDHQQPHDGSFTATEGALELVRGADLVIHDAQYTPEEFPLKNTWGHCTVDYAVWLAAEAGAKRLALFHHDPVRHDDDVDALLCAAQKSGREQGVEVFAASEGLTVELRSS